MRGETFIHRQCKPINEITFMTAESAGQMSLLDECEGNHAAFLNAVCEGERHDAAGGRNTQAQALKAHFDLAPAEFDEAWSKWVKKVYKKR